MANDSEGTRRLRAAVRIGLSTGVWIVVAVQVALPLVAAMPGAADGAARLVRVAAVTFMLFGLLYLIAGASHALAAGRDPVSVPAVVRAGRTVFAPFLWLLLKSGLLAALIVQLGMIAAVTLSGLQPVVLLERVTPYAGMAIALLGFVLVYWMPIVFADRNFALFASLRQALHAAWARIGVSGYLAFLTLAPAAVALLLDAESGQLVLGALNLAASVMGWIAYVYCVEWRQSQPRVAAASLN